MAKYVQKHKNSYECSNAGDMAADDAAAQAKQPHADVEAIDELLDEIDAVLEQNAEEFLRNYVQKGGE